MDGVIDDIVEDFNNCWWFICVKLPSQQNIKLYIFTFILTINYMRHMFTLKYNRKNTCIVECFIPISDK